MHGNRLTKWFVLVLCVGSAAIAAEPPRLIYVDAAAGGMGDGSSWADAYNCLQDALAAATTADKAVEIRVAQGVYKPDQGAGVAAGDRAASFQLLNGVTLNGGYAGAGDADPNARNPDSYPAILSGDLVGNDSSIATSSDNSMHVVTGSGTDATAVLDGFTITGGSRIRGSSSAEPPSPGGEGILIDAGSPTVLNCLLTGNYGSSGGVVRAATGSSPALTNCVFLDNRGTGMVCTDNSNAILTDCRFESAGVDITSSSPVITGCTFRGDSFAMIDATDCNSILTDCVFTGTGTGRLGDDGIFCRHGHLTLSGCTLTGFGGGAINTSGDLTLVGCTFRDNGGTNAAVDCRVSTSVLALECVFSGNSGFEAGAICGWDIELHDCEFTGNSGVFAGAIASNIGSPARVVATGCVFAGNSGGRVGAIQSHSEVFTLSNCTFIGNRGSSGTFDASTTGLLPVTITQCIVRDGPAPFKPNSLAPVPISVTYSNMQGGYAGEGNIDVDPCFVDPGHWDANATPDDPDDDIWVNGDYHLKSQAGHWDRVSETWVRDEVTSACIDAGNPFNPLGVEPFPNGGVINIGAYGGTAEASKSYFGEPVCETQIPGDINGDCKVDQTDLDILMAHWLMEASGLVNNPPVVTLLSPQDGAELTEPTPILFRGAASDPDGTVVRVKYTLEYRTANIQGTITMTTTDPSNDWDVQLDWSYIDEDGTYTAWAEAMDNEGTRTASPKITVTLHPAR